MSLSREAIVQALRSIPLAGSAHNAADVLEDVGVEDGRVRIRLMGGMSASSRDAVRQAAEASLGALGAASTEIEWTATLPARKASAEDPAPEVKNVVLVMSGKGGVGKSTVAANIALGLAKTGAKVGLLDADLYGPSVPTLFGVSEPPMSDGQKILPIERLGLKLMSMGFLLEDPTSAVVWRGPMLHGALLQFLGDVAWGALDFLLLDLPPGTGDIALTLAQRVQSTGAVIVTTPQKVALQDVYKAVSMCEKVGIPVLGVVENESVFVCEGCGRHHELFGHGGGREIADLAHAPLLGQIPLEPSVRQASDDGVPIVVASPDSAAATALGDVAEKLMDRCYLANLAGSAGPTIDRSGGVNRHLPVVR
jgi:ATP-binding protein involved in chromosome partitioning